MTIKTDIEHKSLKSLYQEILNSLDKIETIELDDKGSFETSAFMSMLVSLKNTSNLNIPFLEKKDSYINGLGKIVVKDA